MKFSINSVEIIDSSLWEKVILEICFIPVSRKKIQVFIYDLDLGNLFLNKSMKTIIEMIEKS